MTTAALKAQAKHLIDGLSAQQLRTAAEFLAFIKHRESDAATVELLSIPGFKKSFARGMRDVEAGRTKPWRPGTARRADRDV